MKVYVSSFDLWAARHVADELTKNGHKVVSTWHDGNPCAHIQGRRAIAKACGEDAR